MKTTKNIFLTAVLALIGFTVNSQEIQNLRKAGYEGLNVFETKKSTTSDFEKLIVKVGGDFAIQFQSVDHSNDMNNLTAIGGNVNLPTANLNFDVLLADGVRMHLRTFLSSRHHTEAWVKGGYIQMDKLDFIKAGFLKDFMDITTIRIGVDQLNYGDAHFRRSDNAMAIYNPFVGNYIMDAYTVEPFIEFTFQPNNMIFVAGLSNGLLNPTVDNTIKRWGSSTIVGEKELKATFYGKVGYDSQINDALRVRFTGSFINEKGYHNGDHLYSGDRAGSRYYNIFNYNSSGDFKSGGDFSGRFTPGFKSNSSYQFNPFIKYNGLEFFGVYEVSKGSKAEGNEKGSFKQLGTELLYRFGEKEQFYIGGRYNSVKGNADQLNLVGMTKAVNDLATRARGNQLKPDEIQDGTYTVTNVGGFGSVMGTPIINQPQVAILALGAIRKVPAVIETSEGDFIGIRQKMFVSHSYDHRVVNGALGGMFIKTLKETLEAWDVNQDF